MQIRFEVTVDDLVAFNMHHNTNTSAARADERVGKIVVTLSLILGCGILGMQNDNLFLGVVAGVALTGLFIVIAPPIRRRSFERQLRRHFKKSAGAEIGLQEYSIAENGIHTVAEKGEMTVYWTAISDVIQTKSHCFVYFSATNALVVPLDKMIEGDGVEFIQEVTRRRQAVQKSAV